MNVEDIINAMDDNEKEVASKLLFDWKCRVNYFWARDWLETNGDTELGKSLIAEIKSNDKISAIKGVRNILNTSLSEAKCLVELVIK